MPNQYLDQLTRLRAADALEEQVAWYTVGIVPDRGKAIGTGTAVKRRGHALILTASHVLADLEPRDLWFFTRNSGSLIRGDHREIVSRTTLPVGGTRRRFRIHAVQRDERLDLAILQLSEKPNDNLLFHELDYEPALPSTDQAVVLMGYPLDSSVRVGEDAYMACFSVEWPALVKLSQEQIARLPRLGNTYDERKHLLFNFPSAEDGRDPAGYSGAAFWFRRSVTPGVWHPNLMVAGICTNYYRGEKLLQALRLDRVLEFVDRLSL